MESCKKRFFFFTSKHICGNMNKRKDVVTKYAEGNIYKI